MTLDEEGDRAILLQVMEQTAFPGKFAETVARIKAAIRKAQVEPENAGPDDSPRIS